MKKILVAILFLIIGITMLAYSCIKIVPGAKLASQNCTLKVDAVVVSNEEYDELINDYWYTYYRATVTYTVNGKNYQHKFGEEVEPLEIGSTISIWVDPENPSVMTTTLEWEKVAILSIGFSLFFVMIGVIFTVVVIKNYKRKLVN